LGLAGCYCPVPSSRKEFDATPRQMVKYAPAGWLCSGAVTCALLAGMGFTGDTTVFDGEYGFWRFYGSKKWEPDVVLDKLGKRWLFLEISYKPYACCRYFHSQLDCFISIIEKNNLRPEEIEKVRSFGFPFFTDSPPQEVITQIDAQFCAPYVFAVAAHRVKIGADWQDWDTIRNPKIKEFMKKVTVQVHPEAVGAKNKDRRSWLAKVEIEARGKTFTEERMHAKGTAFTDVRATDEELVAKFRGNAIRFLTEDKIEKAVKMLYELEKMDNVGELMKQVTL
jgi:2-methylcitrate dehydratase PrpD